MIQHKTGKFESTDNLQLFYCCSKPENPQAAIVVVHGVCEHSGRYEWLKNASLEKNISFYSFDHRGHGRSEGKGTEINGYCDYVSDLEQFLHKIVNPENQIPIFLMGHSMGSLIATLYTLKNPERLRGLILSAPPFDPVIPLIKLRFFIGKYLCNIFPNLTVHNGIKSHQISNDPEVVKEYDTDPMVSHKVTLIWGVELIKTIEKLKQQSKKIRLPFLILHGTADTIARIDGARQFLEGVASTDKSIIESTGSKHELHNEFEPERSKVLSSLTEWILKHL
jgi:acylglycerol lipase